MADGASRSRRAVALLRVSSGLEDAGHTGDAAADAAHGAADRAASGAALRLYRQHPRSRRPEHLLSRLRRDPHWPRLVRAYGMESLPRRTLRRMRYALCRGVRRRARTLGTG